MNTPWYQHSYRRMLLDMHIPDWDEAFLSQYDPKGMAELYEKAHLSSVMFYCQSHVGLCNWPTKTGKTHEGLQHRDVVGELIGELKARNIAACGYYSVIFNNWAFLEHPTWRIQPHGDKPSDAFAASRYGLCCPNNPDYHAFALAQVDELVSSHDFDGMFIDMTFWPGVCLCPHCRKRYRDEDDAEIPRVVDWEDPHWCAFSTARERWISRFAADLTQQVKGAKPHVSVYHNFATAFYNWVFACPLDSAVHHDFLGADFYGDAVEQLMVIKTMTNLTEHRPAEFMTSRCVNLKDHERLKRFETMEMQAFAATLFSSAFLFIDAIDPVGTVNPAVYERVGEIFSKTAPYEPYLGGEPIEDIAVYFSNESRVDFQENGVPLSGDIGFATHYPHGEAARGVCRILQQAHMPFGVITRKQLAGLGRYKLVVLPNVLRMDDEEAAAFRAYVEAGGRLYATGNSSLVHSRDGAQPDFMLADVFGCHFAERTPGVVSYMKPAGTEIANAVAPQRYVSVIPKAVESMSVRVDARATGILLAEKTEGTVLATRTLPYGSPDQGSVLDQRWSSIHSSPPWEDTPRPVMVQNEYGKGRAVYSAVDIESEACEVNDRLVLHLLRSLADEPPTYAAEAHPAVWMHVALQKETGRFTIGFLNYQAQLPAIPIQRVPFTLRAPDGRKFTKLALLPDMSPVDFTVDDEGALHAELNNLDVFAMLLAETE